MSPVCFAISFRTAVVPMVWMVVGVGFAVVVFW